jgi:hypothetical protein
MERSIEMGGRGGAGSSKRVKKGGAEMTKVRPMTSPGGNEPKPPKQLKMF